MFPCRTYGLKCDLRHIWNWMNLFWLHLQPGYRVFIDGVKKEMLTNFLNQVQGLEILEPSRFFNDYEKTVIYHRGNGKCAVCNKDVPWKEFEADHIKPWSQGGKTTLDNAQLLCREDNRAKGASFVT